MENEAIENSEGINKKAAGGRPKKLIKQDCFIGIKCSSSEKMILIQKAEAGLKGQAIRQNKVLPKEILLFTATLNHLAANINQIAKQGNTYDQLTAVERIELQALSIQIKQHAIDIKNYLK